MIERLRFDTPVLRSVVRPADLVRATRTLGVLVGAGVPLLDAIQICRGLSPWRRWAAFWDAVESSVRDGRGLADRFEQTGLVPLSARAMVAAGERSGQLSKVLDRVADAADEDLETAVKRVGVLLEPLAILVLGSVIAVVAIALLLPVGLTNGLWGTLCMVWAQRTVAPADRDAASKLLRPRWTASSAAS